MKAICFASAILLLVTCAPKSDKEIASEIAPLGELSPLPGEYVIEMTESFAVPLIKRTFVSPADKISARDTLISQISKYCSRYSIKVRDSIYLTELSVGFASQLNADQIQKLTADKANVLLLVSDFLVRSVDPVEQRDPIQQKRDPIQQSEWDLKPKPAGGFNTCAIETAGGSKKVAAENRKKIFILDTGVDDHANIVLSRDSSRKYIDTETSVRKWRDLNGHGTVVAGIAASKEITYTDETVMPPRIIKISGGVSAGAVVVSYKVLDSLGHGKWRFLDKALDDVGRYGVAGDVVNMSLGAPCQTGCNAIQAALQGRILTLASRGIFVVMAAGNNSGDANQFLPGSINGTNVFTVGSINCDNNCSFYSNAGSSVDFLAVGTQVFSTYRKKRYLVLSGTSMSAAVVSGIVHSLGTAPVGVPSTICSGAPIARRCAGAGQCP